MENQKQTSKLNRILHYYTITTLILLIILPLITTGAIFFQRRDAKLSEMNLVTQSIAASINERANETKRFAQVITSTSGWIQEIERYFSLSYSDHWTYYLVNNRFGLFLPKEMARQYSYNPYLESIHILLNDYSIIYESLATNPYGRKVDQLSPNEDLRIVEGIRPATTLQSIGQLVMTYSLDKIIEDSKFQSEDQLLIYDPTSNLMISTDNVHDEDTDDHQLELLQLVDRLKIWRRDYYLKEQLLSSGHVVIVRYSKWELIKGIFPLGLMITCGFTLMAGFVYFMISKQLKLYGRQVDDILLTTNKIETGQVYYRINESNKDSELLAISKAINTMLDGQQQSMKQVYHLQMKHNQAVLKALQAQVNPHFLYNTLEFIRMSAYLEGAEDLADFVYDFARLMRRNISPEKEASLRDELQFIETYLRLYQARYPNRLVTNLTIDPRLNDILIPKFTLQPLVENYLVHGIDFSETDNQLDIEISLVNQEIQIRVQDNGKGMDISEISNINRKIRKLMHRPFDMEDSGNSLGINIVAQRIAQDFGSTSKMYFEQNQEGGVVIWILFQTQQNIGS